MTRKYLTVLHANSKGKPILCTRALVLCLLQSVLAELVSCSISLFYLVYIAGQTTLVGILKTGFLVAGPYYEPCQRKKKKSTNKFCCSSWRIVEVRSTVLQLSSDYYTQNPPHNIGCNTVLSSKKKQGTGIPYFWHLRIYSGRQIRSMSLLFTSLLIQG